MPDALVITTAGINCDLELVHAFECAGASVESIHLNHLLREPALMDRFDLIGLPGGFSYGDAIAAGRIAAQLMRRSLWPAFMRAIDRSAPIIAPCNGFQIAVQMGLLPGPPADAAWSSTPPEPSMTLAANASARFVDRWCSIGIPANTRCVWTQGIELSGETGVLPIAHGEGRFVVRDAAMVDALEASGQIAVRYAHDDNPNGSRGDIAGICDRSGLIFGLMPHPERYTRWTQHACWTRLDASLTVGDTPGLQMFRNAVRFVERRDARQPRNGSEGVHAPGSSVMT